MLLHSVGGYTCILITQAHTYYFFSFTGLLTPGGQSLSNQIHRIHSAICEVHKLIPSRSFSCLRCLQLNNENKDTVEFIFLLLISCTSYQLFQLVHFWKPPGNFLKVLFFDHLLSTIGLIIKYSPSSFKETQRSLLQLRYQHFGFKCMDRFHSMNRCQMLWDTSTEHSLW